MPFLARAEKGNLSLGVVPIPLAQVLPDCTPRAKEEEKRLLAQICRAAAMVDRVFDENEVRRATRRVARKRTRRDFRRRSDSEITITTTTTSWSTSTGDDATSPHLPSPPSPLGRTITFSQRRLFHLNIIAAIPRRDDAIHGDGISRAPQTSLRSRGS